MYITVDNNKNEISFDHPIENRNGNIKDVYTEEKLHFATKSFTFSRSSGNTTI